ncbi:hypothetical protein HLB42_20210 (plasmid) [Deinococcus sp. D7000]|nr:hypothetical protein HLB42_20210 [Deinococcus sp. D7000]
MVNAPGRWPSLAVTVWSVLSLFAGLALLAFTFVDMAVAGDLGLGMDSDREHPRVDHVSYTLVGFKYLHGAEILTGPHRSLPLALSWLTLSALLMWAFWQRWALPEARQALRASLLTLMLVSVVGGSSLALTTRTHNGLLKAPTMGHAYTQLFNMTSAQLTTLKLWHCGHWVENQGCHNSQESTFPNPALWAVVDVFITAGAGLWHPAEQGD